MTPEEAAEYLEQLLGERGALQLTKRLARRRETVTLDWPILAALVKAVLAAEQERRKATEG